MKKPGPSSHKLHAAPCKNLAGADKWRLKVLLMHYLRAFIVYIILCVVVYLCVCVVVVIVVGQSDVWLTVHRNSVWIRKTN